MRISSNPENLLLRAAHQAKRSAWQLKHVVFDVGEQLWTVDAPVSYALFPLRGVVSLQVSGDRGKRADIALLGREGCTEIPLLLGAEHSHMIATGFTGGEALLMPSELFATFLRDPRFRDAVNRYMRLLLVMLQQFCFCNRVHVIEKTIIGRLLFDPRPYSEQLLSTHPGILCGLTGSAQGDHQQGSGAPSGAGDDPLRRAGEPHHSRPAATGTAGLFLLSDH